MKILETLEYTPVQISKGYTDRILEVDLSSKNISIRELPPDFKDKYFGGRGYALKLIWDGTSAETRYDDPENILVMAGGPLCCDPGFPGTGKFIIGTISPLTDTFIDSNIGGHFAPLLKLCGFDALAVTGLADKEVILVIDGDSGSIEIIEAPLYGEDIDAGALSYGEALLKDYAGELSDNIAAVTAGIAACNARFGIINSLFYDKRRARMRSKQAGRGGTGTVMRKKGLRAVIVRSNLPRANANNPADRDGVREAGSKLRKVISKVDPEQLRLASWGTPILVEFMDQYHILPVNNYQYGTHPDSPNVFADMFLDKYFEKNTPDGCYYGCNLACAKSAESLRLTGGPLAGKDVDVDGPEYETVGAVTCMGIFDPQFTMEYNWYCDEYGLDTISMGVSAGFLMECVQRGYLASKDVGYDLTWGNIEAANRLLHETAMGEGFGKICGMGVHRAKKWVAENYASQNGGSAELVLDELNKFAMEVKGLEFSMYITKESLAQQGGYGFALKGPQHDEAWLIFIDQVHKELPTFELKADALKWFPLIRTWFNAAGLCKLQWIDVRHPDAADTDNPAKNYPTLDYYVKFLNSTIGGNKTLDDMLADSERLQLLQKLINLRNNKGTRENDQIPLRAMGPVFFNEYEARAEYYDEWLKERVGPEQIPGTPVERHMMLMELRQEAYQELCNAVYKEKGYSNNAVPLPETLERFGLLDEKAINLINT